MLPKDPFILVSYMNTQLRDKYENLEALAEGLGIDTDEMTAAVERIREAGYSYDPGQNRFV